jgi:hypothetical protein
VGTRDLEGRRIARHAECGVRIEGASSLHLPRFYGGRGVAIGLDLNDR